MRFHTSLPVTDVDATVRFYTTLFGAEPVKVKTDYAKFLPESGGLNISFHQDAEKVAALRPLHLGFELPSQAALDGIQARLEAAGLLSGPRETSVCCYANQDKFWVTDPSGYQWELYVLLADTEKKIDAGSGCCPGTGESSSAAACGSGKSDSACC